MDLSRRGFLQLAGGSAAALALGLPTDFAEAATTVGPFQFISRYNVVRGLKGSSRKLVTAPRAGGGYIAFWEQSPDFNHDFSYYRLYDNAGRPLGVNTRISIDTLEDEQIGSVVSHPDGTSNVFSFGRMPNEATGALWWMQRVGAGGAKLGPRVKISAGTRGDYHRAVRLADGRMVCAWRDDDLLGNLAKVVTPTGQVLAETPAVQSGIYHNWVEAIAPLPNSAGSVMAFYTGGGEVMFQILDTNLQKVGDELLFPANSGYEGVALAPHPRGFVAVWSACDFNLDNPRIDGAVISPTGQVLTRLQPIRLKPGLDMNNNHELYPALLTLPDGRILVARNKRAVDARGRDVFLIVIYLYGADGRLAAKPVTVYRDTADIGEFFVHINHPRSMIRLRNRSILLTYDTGPWGGPHIAQAVNFKVL